MINILEQNKPKSLMFMPLALSVIFPCQLAYFRISSITNLPTHSYPYPNPNLNQLLLTMRIPNEASGPVHNSQFPRKAVTLCPSSLH
jgi:hypothetical protein